MRSASDTAAVRPRNAGMSCDPLQQPSERRLLLR